MNSIRVTIVENDRPLLDSLAVLVGGTPGYSCMGAHERAEAALKHLPCEKPDVILLDLNLPKMDGVEFIREVRARQACREIVALTVRDDAREIFEALEAGASGYLIKPSTPAGILEAIAEAHRGGSPMSSTVARLVVQAFHRRGKAKEEFDVLTDREEEVLKLLSSGAQYEEIAKKLGISRRTVSTHAHNIYEKLHVRSRGEAAAKYLKKGC